MPHMIKTKSDTSQKVSNEFSTSIACLLGNTTEIIV